MASVEHTLASVTLFSSMSEDQRADLARKSSWREVPAGQQIIDRDSEDSDVYFVTEGRVRVVNYSLSGREISFEDLDKGSFFGEIAALDHGVRSATVVALTDTRLALMPAGLFVETIIQDAGVCQAVLAHMAGIVRRSTERIMDLSTLAANNRVQAEILRLARGAEKSDGTALISPIPVHSDIASRVSTTRETVARVMGDLARLELIERQAHSLLVRDLAALEEMVDEVRGGI